MLTSPILDTNNLLALAYDIWEDERLNLATATARGVQYKIINGTKYQLQLHITCSPDDFIDENLPLGENWTPYDGDD